LSWRYFSLSSPLHQTIYWHRLRSNYTLIILVNCHVNQLTLLNYNLHLLMLINKCCYSVLFNNCGSHFTIARSHVTVAIVFCIGHSTFYLINLLNGYSTWSANVSIHYCPLNKCYYDSLNHLSFNSDKNLIFPHRITTWSNIQVMRIKEMFHKAEMPWCLSRFSQLVP